MSESKPKRYSVVFDEETERFLEDHAWAMGHSIPKEIQRIVIEVCERETQQMDILKAARGTDPPDEVWALYSTSKNHSQLGLDNS